MKPKAEKDCSATRRWWRRDITATSAAYVRLNSSDEWKRAIGSSEMTRRIT